MLRRGVRRAGRAVRRRLSRAEGYIAVRAPLVWRTRLLLWTGVGTAVTAASGAYARTLEISSEELPGLETVASWLSYGLLLLYGLILFIVLDTVRRTWPLLRLSHHLQVLACVALAIFSLSLPLAVFIASLAPRVATLETRDRIAVHADHRFWQCWTDRTGLETAVSEHRQDIDEVSRRFWGRDPTAPFLSVSNDFASRCGKRFPAEKGASYYSVAGFAFLPIGEQLLHIDAAQRYLQGDHSGYGALPLKAAVLLSLIAGVLGTTLSNGRVLNVLSLVRRRWFRGIPRPWQRVSVDRALAVRAPVLWSSRLHVAFPFVLFVPGAMTVLALPPASTRPAIVGYGTTALAVVSLFLALHSQKTIRYMPLQWRADCLVFVVHALCVATGAIVAGLVAPVVGLTSSTLEDNFPDCVLIISMGAAFMAAAMQGARNGSSVATLGSVVGVASVFVALIFANELWFDLRGDMPLVVAVAVCAAGVSILTVMAVRLEARPALRRLALIACLFVAPAPGLALLLILAPTTRAFTWFGWLVSMLLAVAGLVASLYLTRNPRRALAYTAR